MPAKTSFKNGLLAVMSRNLFPLSKKMKPDELRSPGDEICPSPFKWPKSLRQLSKDHSSFWSKMPHAIIYMLQCAAHSANIDGCAAVKDKEEVHTGISSQIGTKLRDWAVRQAWLLLKGSHVLK